MHNKGREKNGQKEDICKRRRKERLGEQARKVKKIAIEDILEEIATVLNKELQSCRV